MAGPSAYVASIAITTASGPNADWLRARLLKPDVNLSAANLAQIAASPFQKSALLASERLASQLRLALGAPAVAGDRAQYWDRLGKPADYLSVDAIRVFGVLANPQNPEAFELLMQWDSPRLPFFLDRLIHMVHNRDASGVGQYVEELIAWTPAPQREGWISAVLESPREDVLEVAAEHARNVVNLEKLARLGPDSVAGSIATRRLAVMKTGEALEPYFA